MTREKNANIPRPATSNTDSAPDSSTPEIIFFGNGPLASASLSILQQHFRILFHAHTKDDLATAAALKAQHPAAHAVLASYGVIIPSKFLSLFEPEGILNIHPSLLPEYRGPSPIETAILHGDHDFGVSVMKLAPAMDAGPIYYQTKLKNLLPDTPTPENSDSPVTAFPDKLQIYRTLAETGANWLVSHLADLPTPVPQDGTKATFTEKITRVDGIVDPATETAEQIYRKIIAFSGFPRVRMPICGVDCIILEASPQNSAPTTPTSPLLVPCADHTTLAITRLQPAGRRPMDAKSFLNGYAR